MTFVCMHIVYARSNITASHWTSTCFEVLFSSAQWHNVYKSVLWTTWKQLSWATIESVKIQLAGWVPPYPENDLLKQLQIHQIANWSYKMNRKYSFYSYSKENKQTFTCSLMEEEDLAFLRYESKSQILCQRYNAIVHTLPTIQASLSLMKQYIVTDYLLFLLIWLLCGCLDKHRTWLLQCEGLP